MSIDPNRAGSVQLVKPERAADHLAEPVEYGGDLLPRGLVLAELERAAREQGHPDPAGSAARWMQAYDRTHPPA